MTIEKMIAKVFKLEKKIMLLESQLEKVTKHNKQHLDFTLRLNKNLLDRLSKLENTIEKLEEFKVDDRNREDD